MGTSQSLYTARSRRRKVLMKPIMRHLAGRGEVRAPVRLAVSGVEGDGLPGIPGSASERLFLGRFLLVATVSRMIVSHNERSSLPS